MFSPAVFAQYMWEDGLFLHRLVSLDLAGHSEPHSVLHVGYGWRPGIQIQQSHDDVAFPKRLAVATELIAAGKLPSASKPIRIRFLSCNKTYKKMLSCLACDGLLPAWDTIRSKWSWWGGYLKCTLKYFCTCVMDHNSYQATNSHAR